MATRTFCDNCEAELVNYKANIRLSVIHLTSSGEYVGEDEYKPADLCLACILLLQKLVPAIAKIYSHPEIGHDRCEEAQPVRTIDIGYSNGLTAG